MTTPIIWTFKKNDKQLFTKLKTSIIFHIENNIYIYKKNLFFTYFFCWQFLLVGATTADLPPGVLYRVKATYKYVKEDVDELSFEVGETIQVIEYDDPEDQVQFFLNISICEDC